MTTKKVEVFTGREDVNKFTTKCDLHCELKGYDGEKKAAFIAGRLEEPAFDVYMALTADDKKDPEKIKTALINSFDNSKRNREVAIEELRHRTRSKDEKAEVFAHKIQELVKNAYPKFDDPSKESLAKDHYVSGLEADMQKELRKLTDFEEKTLVKQTTYFEIAGANATSLQPKCEVIAATNSSRIESRLDRLVNLMERSLGVDEEDEIEEEHLNYAGYRGNRGNHRGQRNQGNRGGRGGRGGKQQPYKCRACNKTGHLFRKCPERYCQSCGNQGHDGWSQECPKYQ